MIDARSFITGAVQLGFGLLFLASGVSKSLRASSVFHIVLNYRLLPTVAARAVAVALGPMESVAGVLLLLSLWLPVYPAAWNLAVGMLLVFSFAVGSALVRGLRIPCGCGLLLNGHVIRWTTLMRNLLLLAALAVDFWIRQAQRPGPGPG